MIHLFLLLHQGGPNDFNTEVHHPAKRRVWKCATSRADMCLNCSLSVKSMKFGMMIVFKALKKIVYGAIAEKSVKCEK